MPDRIPLIRVTAMPADTNPYGGVFGGWLMSQMALAAGSEASRLEFDLGHELRLEPTALRQIKRFVPTRLECPVFHPPTRQPHQGLPRARPHVALQPDRPVPASPLRRLRVVGCDAGR